jgi:hypothetical protein
VDCGQCARAPPERGAAHCRSTNVLIWLLFSGQKRSSIFSTHIQRQLLLYICTRSDIDGTSYAQNI